MNAPAIDVHDLTVQLGDHTALEDLSFSIPEGAFMAILGPNGGGKSTILKVILGLIKPLHGAVEIFGQDPESISPLDVGYVPQFKTMDRSFPALAMELVATGVRSRWPSWMGESRRRAALDALERVGASHLSTRPIGHLSGGELQRVYLARAIVRHPRLILLDEPAAGLDVTGSGDMSRILEEYQAEAKATILMVTHDWGVAFHHASHVLLVNRRKVGFGSPDEALSEQSLRQAFGHRGHAHAMGMSTHDHA